MLERLRLLSDPPFVFDLLDRLTSAAKVARSAARWSILDSRSDDFDSLSDATLCWLTRDSVILPVICLTYLTQCILKWILLARILLTYDDIWFYWNVPKCFLLTEIRKWILSTFSSTLAAFSRKNSFVSVIKFFNMIDLTLSFSLDLRPVSTVRS